MSDRCSESWNRLVRADTIAEILIRAMARGHAGGMTQGVALASEIAAFLEADGWVAATITDAEFNFVECFKLFACTDGCPEFVAVPVDPMAVELEPVLARISSPENLRCDLKCEDESCFEALVSSGNGCRSELMFFRMGNPEPFDESKSTTVKLLLERLPWLLAALTERGQISRDLPPRLVYVFKLLVQGLDRKSIAEHLDLSIHTVGDYTKEIYRHYEVHSQTELVCKFHAASPHMYV
ncbi:MAG: LuxR C-terminal-related transcriptional regulator [Verrucomicrobiales bacterium]|nr:LuxR C-terminal-related transcriptional regulator [Verrucomicrobiales bacterium]